VNLDWTSDRAGGDRVFVVVEGQRVGGLWRNWTLIFEFERAYWTT
jgi:hypothetical protein